MLFVIGWKSSETRNPFVEQAVQYAVAAARATFNKKDMLHKLLLQGNSDDAVCLSILWKIREY